MRLSINNVPVIVAVLAAALFISCTSTPAPVEKPVPPKEAGTQKTPKQFTREGFAKDLEKLLLADQFDAAIALFDTVPEKDAADVSIRKLKASVLISAGKLAEAEKLAVELEAQNPADVDILYMQAVLAEAKKDGKTRTAYLNKILKIEPNNSEALTAIGLDYYSKKNYPQAKSTLVKAIAADKTNTEALLGLARVYYMEAELDKAGDTLSIALERAPNDSLIWAERARVKSETRKLPEALADIEKAISLDPDIYSHRIDAGTYYISAGKQKEAREAFTAAIKIDPEHYLAYIYRAGLNDDLGNADEAISDYNAVCRLYPQYWYASESLGILLWGKGDYTGARERFTEALRFNPECAPYALMTTLCYYREGREADAKAFMSKYLTTLDREKTEYFLCRLFVDRSGDADVLNRITKEKNINNRNRMLFYSAMYYDLFQNREIAQKYYIEILAATVPSFFEYRLSKWALADIEKASKSGKSGDSGKTPILPARTGGKAGDDSVAG
jgi:tetratricopeptide (TPR) repeat protein